MFLFIYYYYFVVLLFVVFVVVLVLYVHSTCDDMFLEDVPLVKFMYLVFIYTDARSVRVTVGDSGLCCCSLRVVFRELITSLVF